jgi:hypothetical protein
MTVCFTPYVRGASFGAWVLPHIGRPDQEEFEVDVCNANAVDLLLALGLEPTSYGDVVAIDVFSNLVTAAMRRHLGKRSPELPTIEDSEPGQLAIVHIGRVEGYIERRLGDLARAIQLSRTISVRRISVGANPPPHQHGPATTRTSTTIIEVAMKMHVSIRLERVEEAVGRHQHALDNPGFCVKCGADAEGVEPDARKYECESCGEPGVYGAEELLMALAL